MGYLRDRLKGKAKKGQRRSSKWRYVRKRWLAKHPRCAVCGGWKKIEVHHIVPFNEAPELELKFDNLMTLCERKKYGVNCHLFIGHLGNYRRVNTSVKRDAGYWNEQLGV